MKETLEIWKDIDGYELYYQISNMGKLRSIDRFVVDTMGRTRTHKGSIRKQRKSKNGYLYCNIWKDGKSQTVKIHRLVAINFVTNINSTNTVNHIDGNKLNNCFENLEWVSCSENIIHAFKNNLSNQKGERNACSRLTEIEVSIIYKMANEGVLTQKDIAIKFNITRSNVSSIKRGLSWNLVTKHKNNNIKGE